MLLGLLPNLGLAGGSAPLAPPPGAESTCATPERRQVGGVLQLGPSLLLTTLAVVAATSQVRGPTFAVNQARPLPAATQQANLLTGTLAVVAAPAPPVVPDAHLLQGSDRRLQLGDDCSQNAFALIAAPVIAVAPQPQTSFVSTPALRWLPDDTSQGACRYLLVDPLASSVPEFQAAPRYPHGVSQTNWRNVAALGAVQTPVVPSLLVSVQLLRTLSETSAGVPKTLTADATVPFESVALSAPQATRQLVDTSRSAPRVLLEVVAPAPPVVPEISAQVDWPRAVQDTSRSAPQVLLAVVQPPAPPFVPGPWLGVDWPRQVQDTSHGVPKTLIADAIAPLDNAQIFQPLAPRNVVDTSAGSPKTLLVIPPLPPVVNHQVWAPDALRPVWDTSRGTPKALTADAQKPFGNPPAPLVERRHQVQAWAWQVALPLRSVVPVVPPLLPGAQMFAPERQQERQAGQALNLLTTTLSAAVVPPTVVAGRRSIEISSTLQRTPGRSIRRGGTPALKRK